jgi:hypothetical protein
MKIELREDGYEKIEERVQAVENLANEGIFAYPDKAPEKCRQIVLETKKLRQALREALLIVPDAHAGKGDAA